MIYTSIMAGLMMSADAEDGVPPHPPLVAGVNETISDNPPFVTSCLARMGHLLALWELGTKVVFESDQWGTVVRIDFLIRNNADPKPLVNRFVCWQSGTNIATAQDIPPLQPAQ
jgi:hypothetical protein